MGPTPPDRIGDGGEHSNLRLGFPRGRLRQGASGHKGGPGDAGGMVKRQGGGGGPGEVCFTAISGVDDGARPCQETGLQQSLAA